MNNKSTLNCCGIKTHNLKNISLELPLKKWITVTGVSGSGKSSLVFDTIYAESQRRFLETLGTYERQFLQGLPQGDFESIENLPASVALKQSNKTGDPRSVIASSADVSDSLRTLFMTLMEPACIKCGSKVLEHSVQECMNWMTSKLQKDKLVTFYITVPYQFPTEIKKQKKVCQDLMIEGYTRILDQGKIISLEDVTLANKESSSHNFSENCEILLDRIIGNVQQEELINRLESIWSQVKYSTQFSNVFIRTNPQEKQGQQFYVQSYCEKCAQKTNRIQSRDLNWQSVLGSCKSCNGLGQIPVLDEQKIIPNTNLSLEEGALKPWNSDTFEWIKKELLRECKKQKINTNTPYHKLSDQQKNWIWSGKNTNDFISIENFFKSLEADRYKSSSRILLAKYRKYILCPSCMGARIGEIGRNASCHGKTFYELFQCEIKDTLLWLQEIKDQKQFIHKLNSISEIYCEIIQKITLLVKLGLGSTHLFRRCRTLSGGEYQRVLLSRVIGNGLTDALYVLDEPSVGLGRYEIPALIECIQNLRDLGNTILMVEHDKSLILASDEIIELGPKGGEEGGYLVKVTNRMPASCVALPISIVKKQRKSNEKISIQNFSAMNCKNLDIEFYCQHLNVITGPSGAGKSTLVTYGLQSALEKLEEFGIDNNSISDDDSCLGVWDKILMPPHFFENNKLIILEQRVLHRTITSVPATLLGLMDILRKHFVQLPQSKQLGLTLSDFSFNGEGGCETCQGKGIVQDDLFFLGQVEKECPDCLGMRYKLEVLEIKFRGKNIHQWLSTSLETCLKLLASEKTFAKTLKLACALGLGHILLGLPTSNMSGGEAQRLRICAALCKSNQKIFCILDEPTRGLSEKDVGLLLECLIQLTQEGHTFVVVEHHELFEKHADYLIKMGPGSGHNGGKIVEKINYISR